MIIDGQEEYEGLLVMVMNFGFIHLKMQLGFCIKTGNEISPHDGRIVMAHMTKKT